MAGHNWMKKLREKNIYKYELPITQLVIPGTHDSGSCIYHYTPMVQAQTLSISEQLQAGVRALDIRCGRSEEWFGGNKDYYIYHGSYHQSKTIESVIEDVNSFLTENSGEVVIVMLKQETGKTDISDAINDIVNDGLGSKLFKKDDMDNRWPTLEECKGKAIVLSRLKQVHAKHYSTTGWDGNFESKKINVGGKLSVHIQDLWKLPWLSNKKKAIKALHDKSKDDDSGKVLYLNFTSAAWTGRDPHATGRDDVNPYLMGSAIDWTGSGVFCIDGAEKGVLDSLIARNCSGLVSKLKDHDDEDYSFM